MNDRQKRDIALVVDDSPDTLSFINDALDAAGITVLVALDGNQAINIAKNLAPDIILLDAIMPNLDGFETCKIIKADPKLSPIPVIFMTGLSDSESVVKALELGGVDYITKPVNPDVLIARIEVHLNNARLANSAHDALDNAGQYFFSASAEGDLNWATPKTHLIIEQIQFEESTTNPRLRDLVTKILDPAFGGQKSIVVSTQGGRLEIRYIGQSSGSAHLFQIKNLERPNEVETLRKHFPETTKREAEVLLWIARGKTNKEIGTILSLSPRTVNKHLEQVFRKLSVENRTSAAILALKHLDSVD